MKRFTVLLSVKIVVSIVVLSISIGGGDAHHELCSTNADGVDNHHQQVEPICELDVVTTVDEQKDILAKVCAKPNVKKDITSAVSDADRLVPTVQRRRIDAGTTLREHCAGGRTQGYLKWVTWPFYERFMHEPLNFMEKFLDRRRSSSDNNNNNETATTDVLIEVLPLRYELLNVHNASASSGAHRIRFYRSVKLGKVRLLNEAPETTRTVHGQLPYAFERRLNVSVVAGSAERLIKGLSMRYDANRSQSVLSDDAMADMIYGHPLTMLHSEIYNYSVVVPAAEEMVASLIGHWQLDEYNVNAILVSIYAENVNRSAEIVAKIMDKSIAAVHLEYRRHNDDRLATIYNPQSTNSQPQTGGVVYPGFRPYFQLACVILFGVIFVVFCDVGKKLLNDYMLRTKPSITPIHNGDIERLIPAKKT